LFQLIGSGIGKVNVSVTRVSKGLFGSEKSGVPEPGSETVLILLVKEREIRLRKLEHSAYEGRLVDDRLPQR
jgi:hypothetical protein